MARVAVPRLTKRIVYDRDCRVLMGFASLTKSCESGAMRAMMKVP